MEKIKKLCVIQARMGSTRLPGKVLLEVNGTPLLEYQINRVRQSKKIDKIMVATSVEKKNDRIERLCDSLGVGLYRGSEDDCLDRYYQCSLQYPDYGHILRVTADCPLIDPAVIDQTISFFENSDYDYVNNAQAGRETFPDGMDTEIFKKSVLHETAKLAELPSDREEVNEYIFREKKYKKGYYAAPQDWSHFRLTVDEPVDFGVVKFVIENSKINDGYLDFIALLTRHPEVMLKNMHIKRNQGIFKTLEKDKIYLKNKKKSSIASHS
ncbi:hypothetical protein A3H09_02255 [Candidatus Falkowbacteria bacterium RIFCSPLOWO2_12_FULL_45_13]|uniref:Acylneuraminate cytidylyltransferase n=2 Tax=Candidatus Falkowiibacteriota TaxID=1752728 RepID=A0A1F5SCF3_9BACT|nr:MAG: hypothetical protein A3H66_01725 [Candidatus Falkowbacteria bacterium RIFCSPLOWO2_02_FULL_45_21]OGF31276.1 MAG: hypothetical protein A3H09_02255 [Candidatus Falkowbacteria bacterium RIFCSPLOWO2_12_FULL_45_13]